MNEFTPNSNRFKEEQKRTVEEKKKVEKVVKGAVKTRKKSDARKFIDGLVTEDIPNIKSYVVTEVLIPTVKNTLWDIFTNSLDMVLFGGTKRSNKQSTAGRVSYRSYYDSDRNRNQSNEPRRSGYSYEDVILETRGEAEDVISRMDELIELYGEVSVGDLYDLVGITGNYTDEKYGWKNIRNAEPIRVGQGYMIKLPKVTPL
jgi:hypothetical protein